MPVRRRSLSLRNVRNFPRFLIYRESKRRKWLLGGSRPNPSLKVERRGRKGLSTQTEGSRRDTRRGFSCFPSITLLFSPTRKLVGNIGNQAAISPKWPNSWARKRSYPPNPERSARASTSARRRKFTPTSISSKPPSFSSSNHHLTANPWPSLPITWTKWRNAASTWPSSLSAPSNSRKMWR